MGMMTDTLLLTWHMTGDEKYLAPLRSMARIQLKYLKNPPQTPPAAGTAAWCAQNMSRLSSTLAKYRFLTGAEEFDALLDRRMTPYMRYRRTRNIDDLAASLKDTADALSINFAGYTSEVRYTDRVLRFPELFDGSGIVAKTSVPIGEPDPSLLYSTVTGDPGSALYFPLNAVRWLTPSRNIAILVTESQTERFTAKLFNFDKTDRPMSAQLYLLTAGKYNFQLTRDDSKQKMPPKKPLAVKGPRTQITFTLPAQATCTLTVGR
jgi:hypothetical protein